jgi:hypothetical protein
MKTKLGLLLLMLLIAVWCEDSIVVYQGKSAGLIVATSSRCLMLGDLSLVA